MHTLLHHFVSQRSTSDAIALQFKKESLSYSELNTDIEQVATALLSSGLQRHGRVAVYLPKQFETVTALFGTSAAGGAFVPVNPGLKAPQVGHILRDCDVSILVTSAARAKQLAAELGDSPALQTVVLVDNRKNDDGLSPLLTVAKWADWLAEADGSITPHRCIDTDLASILYTSGSTGKPKGVMLSHRNMRCGALSVAEYLENTESDKLLAVLPLSFDYGLSQLTTAFAVGATAVLMDYLLPRDVLKAVARYQITGLAAVPPLWFQLAQLEWPTETSTLRYFTNSGGAMPKATLTALRAAAPQAKPYLMYGLTEAFRSSYLPPELVDKKPDSMGQAIPNAELMVLREDGSECDVNEPGELVHRGSLVALGYWNDAIKTAERFKPLPNNAPGATQTEIAVFSGDTVRRDADGILYFIGRRDEMIKTSGYRVSPQEVEESIFSSKLVSEAIAFGCAHPQLGQAIVVVVQSDNHDIATEITAHCKKQLPNYMVPSHIAVQGALPRNPNGKIDRKALAAEYAAQFAATND